MKIIFILFCDDVLCKIYENPSFWDSLWIYQKLSIGLLLEIKIDVYDYNHIYINDKYICI